MDPLHSTSAAPPPAPGADRGGPVPISPLGLAAAAAPLLFLGALSARLHLGLARQLAVGALRCAAQLSALGYVLVPIFAANSPWVTAAYAAAMCAVAAAEAVSRPARGYPGMLPQALAALALVCGAVIAFGLAVAVGARPWFDAAYLIPMLGMLLGNACSGVAVGLSAVLDELAAQRDRVEALLALGATRGEAAAPVVRRAARLALTPLLNSMNVVGIVSIPGMMSGQILGGSPIAVAARYQIVIFFLVAASTGLTVLAAVHAAAYSVLDDRHRLRLDRLAPSAGAGAGALGWLGAQAAAGWAAARRGGARLGARLAAGARRPTPLRARHSYFRFRAAAAAPGEAPPMPSEGTAPREGVEEPLLGGGEEP